MLRHNGNQKTKLSCDNGFLCRDIIEKYLKKECCVIILLCCDKDQANGSRVLSRKSNLCCDIKS